MTEKREQHEEITRDGIHARVGLVCLTADPIAGGPVELEFVVEALGDSPVHLAVGGDRSRQRPGQFVFSATFAGTEIADPMAGIPDLGGPLGVVEISQNRPWRQPLILNQFLKLEETVPLVKDGMTGRLDVTCQRPLALSFTAAGALTGGSSPPVTFGLSFNLRRDDAKLKALVLGLLDEVITGEAASRELVLTQLLSLRSTARDQIVELTSHPDTAVSNRASQALGSIP